MDTNQKNTTIKFSEFVDGNHNEMPIHSYFWELHKISNREIEFAVNSNTHCTKFYQPEHFYKSIHCLFKLNTKCHG